MKFESKWTMKLIVNSIYFQHYAMNHRMGLERRFEGGEKKEENVAIIKINWLIDFNVMLTNRSFL